MSLKTVKQEEPVARSRFADCAVCKNHTLKLKRMVQVGRCKTCNETYKIIILYVKTGRKTKPASTAHDGRGEEKAESTTAPSPPSSNPSSESGLSGTSGPVYSGLSSAIFGETREEERRETGSTGSQ